MLPIRKGEVMFKGRRLNGMRPDRILREGISFVPQERALFPKMTVRENLRIGGFILPDQKDVTRRVDDILDRFPMLRSKADEPAGTMSGGQQQTLAMARTLIIKPSIVMLDEPSLGLAPKVIQEMFDIMKAMSAEGITVLLVEQNALMGLKNADWGVVLDLGRTLFEGPAREILADPRIQELYPGGRKSAA